MSVVSEAAAWRFAVGEGTQRQLSAPDTPSAPLGLVPSSHSPEQVCRLRLGLWPLLPLPPSPQGCQEAPAPASGAQQPWLRGWARMPTVISGAWLGI